MKAPSYHKRGQLLRRVRLHAYYEMRRGFTSLRRFARFHGVPLVMVEAVMDAAYAPEWEDFPKV